MGRIEAGVLLFVTAVFASGLVWALMRVLVHWHDQRYWLSFSSRATALYGKKRGLRFARTVPSLLWGGVVFLVPVAVAGRDLVAFISGSGDFTLSDAQAWTILGAFVAMTAILGFAAVVWRFGAPTFAIPPALRPPGRHRAVSRRR